MDRRLLLRYATWTSAWMSLAVTGRAQNAACRPVAAAERRNEPLVPSGPVASRTDNQVIEGLDIQSATGDALIVRHRGVVVRNCRIRHAGGHGVHGLGAHDLVLRDLDIDHAGAGGSGEGDSANRNNINIEDCAGVLVEQVRASRGSSNIYAVRCERAQMRRLELHDARGPAPRGQNIQLDKAPDAIIEDFSAENGPTSWTEDNVSVFQSDRCIVRRGLVSYNNSPSGDGVMIEGSFDCVVEDVDAAQQGNGAFAAVPTDERGSGGCVFRRCRTRDSYNVPRDGRAAPTSDSISFYMRISAHARRHVLDDCQWDALANPDNLLWDERAVRAGWTLVHRPFTPRMPLRLTFGW